MEIVTKKDLIKYIREQWYALGFIVGAILFYVFTYNPNNDFTNGIYGMLAGLWSAIAASYLFLVITKDSKFDDIQTDVEDEIKKDAMELYKNYSVVSNEVCKCILDFRCEYYSNHDIKTIEYKRKMLEKLRDKLKNINLNELKTFEYEAKYANMFFYKNNENNHYVLYWFNDETKEYIRNIKKFYKSVNQTNYDSENEVEELFNTIDKYYMENIGIVNHKLSDAATDCVHNKNSHMGHWIRNYDNEEGFKDSHLIYYNKSTYTLYKMVTNINIFGDTLKYTKIPILLMFKNQLEEREINKTTRYLMKRSGII